MPYTHTDKSDGQTLLSAEWNAVGRAVARGLTVHNAKEYGAVGDGTTDDSAAVQDAHDAAFGSATGYGVVYFPPSTGDYVLEGIEVTERVEFWGEPGVTLLHKPGAALPMFTYPSGFTGYHHGLAWRNLGFDGNKANQSLATLDVIHLWKPGFGCGFFHSGINNAERYGIKIEQESVNFTLVNPSGAGCGGGFLHQTLPTTANPGLLEFYGGQIDNCGDYPVDIDKQNDGSAFKVAFYGTKFEEHFTVGHLAPVRITPNAGNGAVTLMVVGMEAYRLGGGGTAGILEAAGSGTSSEIVAIGVQTSGYTNAVDSVKGGYTSGGARATFFARGAGTVHLLNAIAQLARVNTSDVVLASRIFGDTNPRFSQRADGRLQWSAGAATAIDTELWRAGADLLVTSAGDSFSSGAAIWAQAVAEKTANATLTLAEHHVKANGASGSITLTLPTAVGNPGKEYDVVNVHATNNAVLDPNGSQTIFGPGGAATTKTLAPGAGISVYSDGANWIARSAYGTIT